MKRTILALAAIVIAGLLWFGSILLPPAQEQAHTGTAAESVIILPSRLADAPEVEYVTLPLYFREEGALAPHAITTEALSAEQKAELADFKARILARIKSGAPLLQSEKDIIRLSTSVADLPLQEGLLIVDQRLLAFSDDELAAINAALQR